MTLDARLTTAATARKSAIDILAQFVDTVNNSLVRDIPQFRDPNEAGKFLRLSPALASTQTPEQLAETQRVIDELVQRERERQQHIREIGREFPGVLFRTSLIYRVALFDAFFTDIQLCVLTHKPELLKNEDRKLNYTEIVDAILQNRLIEIMAERTAQSISRQSMSEQLTKIANRLKAGLRLTPQDEEKLTELIARRNLFTHANGCVDDEYKKLVPNTTSMRGDQLEVTYQYWNDGHQLLRAVCNQLLQAIFASHCPGIAVANV